MNKKEEDIVKTVIKILEQKENNKINIIDVLFIGGVGALVGIGYYMLVDFTGILNLFLSCFLASLTGGMMLYYHILHKQSKQ